MKNGKTGLTSGILIILKEIAYFTLIIKSVDVLGLFSASFNVLRKAVIVFADLYLLQARQAGIKLCSCMLSPNRYTGAKWST